MDNGSHRSEDEVDEQRSDDAGELAANVAEVMSLDAFYPDMHAEAVSIMRGKCKPGMRNSQRTQGARGSKTAAASSTARPVWRRLQAVRFCTEATAKRSQ